MQSAFEFDPPIVLTPHPAPSLSGVTSAELGWLAGIIDGEGNLQATVQAKKCGSKGGRQNYFQPKIRITNTDVRMIRRVSEIYVKLGLVFFYAINSVKRYKNRKSTWRNQMEITVASKIHIVTLLEAVMPYLVNKQRYASIMLEATFWVQSRPRRGRHSKGVNYTEEREIQEYIVAMASEREFHIEPETTVRIASTVLHWPGCDAK